MIYDANQIKIETHPMVVGLPTSAYVEYFGELGNGSPFVIFRPREDWSYDDFRCVVNSQTVRILETVRYRDGGTTNVGTEIGIFHFPTPFNKEAKATFNDVPIVVYERV